MPGGDGTGPRVLGPLTGWGLDCCRRYLARGRGFGRCRRLERHDFAGYLPRQIKEPVTLTKEEQKNILESEFKGVKAEEDRIRKELENPKE